MAKANSSPYTPMRPLASVSRFTSRMRTASVMTSGTWNTTPNPSMKLVTMPKVSPSERLGVATPAPLPITMPKNSGSVTR
ncbi:MAG: hypothetical protein A4E28_03011 [Methanocella sp. PtaU1.Bin125]|nr:MAG: hypothetical protein A4E28_03011 [Methanocella sp. PtaU1.Bin125]